jgi:hypothetical protein
MTPGDAERATQVAMRAVDAIIRHVRGRRGLQQPWEELREDTREDIRQVWISLVVREILEGDRE